MIDNHFGLDMYEMPVIAVDFDGTIAEDAYPEIGDPIHRAIETINRWFDNGYWIVIYSCRAGGYEIEMRDWLSAHGVKFHTVNQNLPWRIDRYGSDTRKIGADIYLDDHSAENVCKGITWENWVVWETIVDNFTWERSKTKHGDED